MKLFVSNSHVQLRRTGRTSAGVGTGRAELSRPAPSNSRSFGGASFSAAPNFTLLHYDKSTSVRFQLTVFPLSHCEVLQFVRC